MHRDFVLINLLACRDDLVAPAARGDGLIDQRLPDDECGRPQVCGLQEFVQNHRWEIEALSSGLDSLPAAQKDKETVRRIEALAHVIDVPQGEPFEGKQCHRCGDALICVEAPENHVVATKNARHFGPIAAMLNKPVTIACSATRTRAGT
jgi:hypothetical protein